MSLIRFLIILGIGTVLSWTAWVLVLMTLDPISGGSIALMLFHGSFWLALFGTTTIIGFFLRYWLEKETVLFRQITVAVRHATIVASGSSLALLLQGQRLLNIWSIIALAALAIVVELFFLSGQTRRPTATE